LALDDIRVSFLGRDQDCIERAVVTSASEADEDWEDVVVGEDGVGLWVGGRSPIRTKLHARIENRSFVTNM
jgi:hypothetical protein